MNYDFYFYIGLYFLFSVFLSVAPGITFYRKYIFFVIGPLFVYTVSPILLCVVILFIVANWFGLNHSVQSNSKKYSFGLLLLFLVIFLVLRFYETSGLTKNIFVLPGLSFICFKFIESYFFMLRTKQKRFDVLEWVMFYTYPPLFFAGPLITRKAFADIVTQPYPQYDYTLNFLRLGFGIFLKVIVVDQLLKGLWQPVLGKDPSYFMLGLMAYMIAYLDLKAYADIVISLSSLTGYKLPENLNSPWKATNISDFWGRWHITVSNWCTQNVYYPFFGKTKKPYLSILASMSFMGLWHGFRAGWIFWGLSHAIALIIYSEYSKRSFSRSLKRKNNFSVKMLGWAVTQIFIIFIYGISWSLNSMSSDRFLRNLIASLFTNIKNVI
ncbi:MBOAT family O-acyltransferase [Bdellovibrio reynosensis]|uniref:MBOAT family protein n=1 Tax=Bdellovibrio reynosensis TaxID=2835041 RepID=A0ABY4CB93_9BACT|nr:MBOAT family O-acyltransferase [Bdellovibrio reynosensis]UOF02241.1 hypothetical protein MNR06_04670 [Bdellovibrio reynosensis]